MIIKTSRLTRDSCRLLELRWIQLLICCSGIRLWSRLNIDHTRQKGPSWRWDRQNQVRRRTIRYWLGLRAPHPDLWWRNWGSRVIWSTTRSTGRTSSRRTRATIKCSKNFWTRSSRNQNSNPRRAVSTPRYKALSFVKNKIHLRIISRTSTIISKGLKAQVASRSRSQARAVGKSMVSLARIASDRKEQRSKVELQPRDLKTLTEQLLSIQQWAHL